MGKPAETLLRAAALWALAAGQTAWAVDESYATIANLIERVGRLEQRTSGQALATMVGQSEELRAELRSLRGDLEQLTHDIEELKQQQRSQYQDLDQRIQALAGGAAPAAGKPAVPPAAGDAAAPAGQQPPPADAEAAKQAYQKAFNSLKEGRYKEATGLFKAFLAAYPSGDNVDNAQYWLGESYYVTRDFNAAKEAFRKVVDGYPKSAKAADALLRLGYIEYDSEHWAAAAQVLADVSKRYPGSSAAQQAQARLQKMKQEGH